jgi:hypothetical protein
MINSSIEVGDLVSCRSLGMSSYEFEDFGIVIATFYNDGVVYSGINNEPLIVVLSSKRMNKLAWSAREITMRI